MCTRRARTTCDGRGRPPALRLDGRPPGASSRRAGFTFLELLIVIGLLGILYSVGTISFQGLMPKYYIKSASRRLGTTIEHVRLSAVNRGRWMGMRYVLDPRGDERPYYEILPPPPDDFPDQPFDQRQGVGKEYLPTSVRFARIILSSSRSVDHGSINVLFSPMGNAGSHIVVLEGDGGRQMSLKMNCITGTIDFVENGLAAFQNFQE